MTLIRPAAPMAAFTIRDPLILPLLAFSQLYAHLC
jgi:hypothetical protein